MKDDTFRHIYLPLLVLTLLLIVSRVTLFEVTHFTTDDAYTTYRYARNIAAGEGFVYNPGERVQGTSSPLYTLYLAGITRIVGYSVLPLASRVTGIAADILTLWLLWTICHQFSLAVKTVGGLLFALFPKINLIGISGMEAPLVTMFMLLSWFLLQRANMKTSLLVCGFVLLTRADSGLWVLLLIAAAAVQSRITWKALILPLVIYGGWMLFAWQYFGSWIPHAVTAKRVSWIHLFPAFDPLRVMSGYLSLHFADTINALIIVIFILPVIIDAILLVRDRSALAIFPLFFLSYNVAFSFARILVPDWYYYPGYITYIVSISHLLSRLSEKILPKLRHYLCPAVVIGTALTLAFGFAIAAPRWATSLGQIGIEQNGRMGLWLRDHAPVVSRVLVEPIGQIGWESNLLIDDYIGIVSPQVIEYRERFSGSDRWYMCFLKEQRPDYIIQRNWEFQRNALFHGFGGPMFGNQEEFAWFMRHYRQASWNALSSSRDSVSLVLFERTTEPF
jgi:hypothetical protein